MGPGTGFDIACAEALAIELGLLMVLHHGLLESCPVSQRCLLVHSDNAGVVAVLRSGRSRSLPVNNILKRIYTTCAINTISLQPVFVPSRENITDALSRGDVTSFLAGFPLASVQSDMTLPAQFTSYLVPWST